MKLLSLVLLGLASIVTAQETPACAAKCLQQSLAAQSKCSATDINCICTDEPLNTAVQGCVLKSCTVIEALAAQNATQTLCGAPVRDITSITPVIAGVSGGLALMAVIIRVWITGANFGLDDGCVVAALTLAIPMAVLEFLMSNLGFGKDIWTIEPENIYEIVKFTWLTEIFWFAAVGLTKLSFLFMYLRVFPRQKLRKLIYVALAIGMLETLIFTVTVCVNCLPVTYIWESWDGQHSGKCIDLNAFVWSHAIIDIVFDIFIFAIPIPELIKLNMSLRKRIMIVAMFSVGGVGTIISILRLQALVSFSNSTNPTFDNCPTAYWSVLACFVGIFCACMPSLRRLLARLFPNCFLSTKKDSKYSPYNDEHTPNARLSTNPRKPSKAGLSTIMGFGGITKTIDTQVTMAGRGEEDEQELVNMGKKAGWVSSTSAWDPMPTSGTSGKSDSGSGNEVQVGLNAHRM
ncbi:hypothetical protein DM02DRAFT_555946 [Periconia macrospinosa]|uniref:CFEM domain-containing protein n=1 Tax=Periconia macrospinosa TaxID=97972 RepID=A0A2V1E2E9_9PLEO|nr:hypothetical protein DM02DRAFT_555946 [Periconia macrospinosa]